MCKYRVYDNEEKRYVQDYRDFYLNPAGDLMTIKDGIECDVLVYVKNGRYTVEMSTGKEDFTGKTIYDGDTAIDQDDEEVLIEYDKEDAMFHIVYGTYVETFSVIDSKDLKVNGNIHGKSDER